MIMMMMMMTMMMTTMMVMVMMINANYLLQVNFFRLMLVNV